MKNMKRGVWCGAAAMVVAALLAVNGLSGCSTLDRAYKQEVTWTNAPMVSVFTNTVVQTNTIPIVVERTNVVYVTNATTGCLPFQVMVLAYWITASTESSKAPFQCCSKIPQQRSIGLYLLW